MLRKIAVAAASKPTVEIKQEGDSFYIKTSTTVRTTEINFKIGEEFEEQTVDGRACKVRKREPPPPIPAPTYASQCPVSLDSPQRVSRKCRVLERGL